MAKVTGEKMTAAEQRGEHVWYCQFCGSELDRPYAGDPTGRLKCPKCTKAAGASQSWWATTPPAADDVDDRQAQLKAAADDRERAHKDAKR